MAEMQGTGLVRELLGGFWKTQVVTAAAALGLADRMGGDAHGAAALAAEVGADGDSLFRLLRALAALGLATHEEGDRFRLTAAGHCLATAAPESLRGMALHAGTLLAPAFCNLADSVRTGAPPPGIKFGPDGFAELNDDPEQAHVFNQSMVDGSRRIARLAAIAYDFGRFARVCDVGGGYGAVLSELLRRHSAMTGSVLDLEHARAGAEALLAADGVDDRARFVARSFFDPVPAEADAYILKYIIHDWADDYARQIMDRVGRAAQASGGTVILIERVLPERVEACASHAGAIQGDLTMMLWGGKERTEADYRALFEGAGLRLTAIVPVGEGFSVLEGRPA